MRYTLSCFLLFCTLSSFAISPITGTLTVCSGSTTALSDATPGGVWSSSSTAIATVGSGTGIVTGVAAGTAIITYKTLTDSTYATVTVNPTPALSSPLIAGPVCDSSLFIYAPGSSTVGTAFTWSRSFVLGISLPAGAGVGTVSETLVNTTNVPLAVVYVYTLTAGSCSNVENVTVTVNPIPRISSSLTPPALCDSEIFNYTPTSFVAGATFTWHRSAIAGIAEGTSSGTGNPNELLYDTSALPIPVAYTFVVAANGCTNTETVTLTVNPIPKLSSPLLLSLQCDTEMISYVPASSTAGAVFAWARPAMPGIIPPTSFGTGSISELLTDTTAATDTVVYLFRLSINGCTNAHTQEVKVVLNHCAKVLVEMVNAPGSWSIAPNPASDIVTISRIGNMNKIALFNASGQLMFTQDKITDNQLYINISAFTAGVYYLTGYNENGPVTSKIIKL